MRLFQPYFALLAVVAPNLQYASYARVTEYFQSLAKSTKRMRLLDAGKSTGGRSMFVAAIGDPADLRHVETERIASWNEFEAGDEQHAAELAEQLVSETTPAGAGIHFIACNNPDGVDLLADWHNQNLHSAYENAPLPRLLHRYAGSDMRADAYMMNLPETRNLAKFHYRPELVTYETAIPSNQFELLQRLELNGATVQHSTDAAIVRGGERTRYMVEQLHLPQLISVTPAQTAPVDWRRYSPRVAVYEPWLDNPDTGWTEWVLDMYRVPYTPIHNEDFATDDLDERFQVILLGAQPLPTILHGDHTRIQRPEYAGGIELDGAAHLQHFVQRGGTLITLGEASLLPLELFGVPLKSRGRSEALVELHAHATTFFGSAVDGLEFENASAVSDVVRYSSGALAVARVRWGKGHVVLFGIRPQYRGQTFTTFQLLLDAILVGVRA